MTVEDTLFATVGPLCGNRCYPKVAKPGAAKPYVTYDLLPGRAINFVEAAVPGLRNGIFQINCWATTNADAMALARAVEEAMIVKLEFQTTVLNSLATEFNEVAQLYGSRQEFSVWF